MRNFIRTITPNIHLIPTNTYTKKIIPNALSYYNKCFSHKTLNYKNVIRPVESTHDRFIISNSIFGEMFIDQSKEININDFVNIEHLMFDDQIKKKRAEYCMIYPDIFISKLNLTLLRNNTMFNIEENITIEKYENNKKNLVCFYDLIINNRTTNKLKIETNDIDFKGYNDLFNNGLL